jgi:hypothetical protein
LPRLLSPLNEVQVRTCTSDLYQFGTPHQSSFPSRSRRLGPVARKVRAPSSRVRATRPVTLFSKGCRLQLSPPDGWVLARFR